MGNDKITTNWSKRKDVRHRRRSKQISGGETGFFIQNLPKPPRKKLQQIDLQKNDCISFHCGRIFSNQSTWSTIFSWISYKLAQISPNALEKTITNMIFNIKSLQFYFGRHFVKSKHIKWFCEGFQAFCPIFHRFFPDFHQIKTFGDALEPHAPPAAYTTDVGNSLYSTGWPSDHPNLIFPGMQLTQARRSQQWLTCLKVQVHQHPWSVARVVDGLDTVFLRYGRICHILQAITNRSIWLLSQSK